jgi:hypothetical protein
MLVRSDGIMLYRLGLVGLDWIGLDWFGLVRLGGVRLCWLGRMGLCYVG